MKLKWIFLPLIAVAGLSWSGCVGTLDGERRMGNPMVKDSIEGRYERGPQEIWTAAKDVINHHGTLVSEDAVKNTLQGNIDERRVWIFVQEIDAKTTRVVVQVRTRRGGADVQMASFLDKEIAVRLTSNNLTPTTRQRL